MFRISGLLRGGVESRIQDYCRTAGDFLRIVMDEVARRQGARAGLEMLRKKILHLSPIKKTLPEAVVIHVIRDGRDVSVSLSKKRYLSPFPLEEARDRGGAALYWEWIVRKGRAANVGLGNAYIEVRFEQLVRTLVRCFSA